jgi:uncharacterized protein
MNASNKSKRLTAEEVLRRYTEERLPSFVDISLLDVNQMGRFGERPLHIASSRGNVEEIAALVEGGADLDSAGDLGNTPLHEAVSQNHIEAVSYLLKHGASTKVKNEFGQTPLDLARSSERDDIVKILTR